ncbi:hypothetical protein IBX65_06130 [Candidatus Aerophobetes bacterium]|nr:hypothetical protein [Candidatus Aerophobetes bacterium]
MKLQTASQVINFALQLEENLFKLYENLAKSYPEKKDIFLSFARENKKNKTLIQRVYQEVVSDALETGFSFEGLDVDERFFQINLSQDDKLSSVLKKAQDIEKRIQNFYQEVALKSKSFLADVPGAFERIAKKKEERKQKINSLI